MVEENFDHEVALIERKYAELAELSRIAKSSTLAGLSSSHSSSHSSSSSSSSSSSHSSSSSSISQSSQSSSSPSCSLTSPASASLLQSPPESKTRTQVNPEDDDCRDKDSDDDKSDDDSGDDDNVNDHDPEYVDLSDDVDDDVDEDVKTSKSGRAGNRSTPARDKFYRVYLIRLDHPTKNVTYVGSTNDMVRRLRQHNGEIKGGAKSTSRRSCRGRYKWTVICTVGGPNMTHREALQFEKKVKVVRLSDAKGTTAARAQGKDRDDRKLHQRVRKMLIVSSLERWSKKSDRLAKDVPLTFTWYDPSYRPVESAKPYLPPYVDEVIAR